MKKGSPAAKRAEGRRHLRRGGFKVFSAETEERLYGHPAVKHCAIIAIPTDLLIPGIIV